MRPGPPPARRGAKRSKGRSRRRKALPPRCRRFLPVPLPPRRRCRARSPMPSMPTAPWSCSSSATAASTTGSCATRSTACALPGPSSPPSSSPPTASPATRRSPRGWPSTACRPWSWCGRRSSTAAASRSHRSATASRARRASSKRRSTPATRARRSTTTPEGRELSMDSRDYPNHLRAVPDSRDPTAPVLDPDAGGPPGLTPPRVRGRSSGFVTDVLVDLGYVSDDVARQAIEGARTAGRPPERLMVEQGAINADQLSRAVAERYGLDHVDLSVYQVDMAAANLISVNTARRYGALPVGFIDKETLVVAMADPTNVLAVDDIQIATSLDCRRGGHRGPDRSPQHAAERRQRGGHRGRRKRRPGAGRGQRHRSQRRGRARGQARLQHPRPGGGGGRLRQPLRSGRGRDAGPLPD